jgi:hypothetical protein
MTHTIYQNGELWSVKNLLTDEILTGTKECIESLIPVLDKELELAQYGDEEYQRLEISRPDFPTEDEQPDPEIGHYEYLQETDQLKSFDII